MGEGGGFLNVLYTHCTGQYVYSNVAFKLCNQMSTQKITSQQKTTFSHTSDVVAAITRLSDSIQPNKTT